MSAFIFSVNETGYVCFRAHVGTVLSQLARLPKGVIPGRPEKAGPGIQMQTQSCVLDFGFAHYMRAPE